MRERKKWCTHLDILSDFFTPEKKSNTDADTFLYSWLLPACHSCKANLDYSFHVEKQAAFLSINFLQIRLKCT